MAATGYVYILASRPRGTLYVGVTSNLIARVQQHRDHTDPESFTARYAVHELVYYEGPGDIREAIRREKTLKSYRRAWKLALISRHNPTWTDLYPGLIGGCLDHTDPGLGAARLPPAAAPG